MSAKCIIGAAFGSIAIAYFCDTMISDRKLFGEWLQETDKKFQAWPRTAGPPVVMNPISRQNFFVKSSIKE